MSAGNNLTVEATLHGRSQVLEAFDFTLTSASIASAPAMAGTSKAWLQDGKVHFEHGKDGHDFQDVESGTNNEVKIVGAPRTRFTQVSVESKTAAGAVLVLTGVGPDDVRKALADGSSVRVTFRASLLTGDVKDQPFKVVAPQTSYTYRGTGGELKVTGGKKIDIAPDHFAATELRNVRLTSSSKLDVTAQVLSEALATFTADASGLEIDVSKARLHAIRDALAADREVEVEAEWTWAESFGGYYTKDTNVIVLTTIKVRDDEAADVTKKRMLTVACHELGHALGLVRASQPRRTAGEEINGDHYTGHNGQGSHCKLHAHAEDYADSSSGDGKRMVPDDGAEKLCIMFHTLAYLDRMDTTFCTTCSRHLVVNEVKLPQ